MVAYEGIVSKHAAACDRCWLKRAGAITIAGRSSSWWRAGNIQPRIRKYSKGVLDTDWCYCHTSSAKSHGGIKWPPSASYPASYSSKWIERTRMIFWLLIPIKNRELYLNSKLFLPLCLSWKIFWHAVWIFGICPYLQLLLQVVNTQVISQN